MSSSHEAMNRFWFILSKIPRFPQTVTVKELKASLEDDGIYASLRMIQRDLNFLSSMSLFPITHESIGKKHAWFWPTSCAFLTLPAMSSNVALTFHLAQKYLSPLLPPHLLNDLQPYFDSAERILDSQASKANGWRDKILHINSGPFFHHVTAEPDILASIYQAVFQQHKFKAVYNRRNGNPKCYVLSPLGIAVKGARIYLVAMNEKGDVKQYFVNRFISIELLSESAAINKDFSLAHYAEQQGMFDYPRSTNLETIELAVKDEFIFYFNETKIGEDQHILSDQDGTYMVRAKALITDEMLWWLVGRANMIKVLSPKMLKDEVKRLLVIGLESYS
ncbi:helix-turn-helix transcriptional regulator [Alteromonas facilis]|uniref:helix-turn-helix transcriptional regulator n=1 Tax=Alteromonas facilis TaxID=2048004 RepID=UPI000C282B59|nr:WYL domain-containing protein [Alteromonas facilis]